MKKLLLVGMIVMSISSMAAMHYNQCDVTLFGTPLQSAAQINGDGSYNLGVVYEGLCKGNSNPCSWRVIFTLVQVVNGQETFVGTWCKDQTLDCNDWNDAIAYSQGGIFLTSGATYKFYARAVSGQCGDSEDGEIVYWNINYTFTAN